MGVARHSRRNDDAIGALPTGASDESTHRSACEDSNARFLAALRRVTIPPEPPAPAEQRFRALPPPSLTSEAFS
jgi:hypothetical protein